MTAYFSINLQQLKVMFPFWQRSWKKLITLITKLLSEIPAILFPKIKCIHTQLQHVL